uniref:BUB1 N-terminal domain-containing protein n=1 Tax=Esox lucius TaxID=8010 RepID=A0AAY5K935_ESOLU
MAEGGEAEWELSKENIQPLKKGRAISALQEALSQQQEGSSSIHNLAFESELRVYEGDDPLDVWDRYVKWTEQTYPQGGKESNLTDKRYHNDRRYVDLWIKFGNGPEPLDIYRYMRAQGIGVQQSSFYIAWSEEYENQGNFRAADNVYQESFKREAEPRENSCSFTSTDVLYCSFFMLLMLFCEEDEDNDMAGQPERASLVDLKHRGKKKAVAPICRVGAALSSNLQLHGPQAPGSTGQNSRILIFDEQKTASAEPSEPKLESWKAPPPSKSKENEQRPEKWNQFASLYLFLYLPPRTPCKINPAVNSVLSARKPCRNETPLKRLQQQEHMKHGEGIAQGQSMYCKELLFSGATEFCFEELRAERYRQKMAVKSEGSVKEELPCSGLPN